MSSVRKANWTGVLTLSVTILKRQSFLHIEYSKYSRDCPYRGQTQVTNYYLASTISLQDYSE